MNIEFTHSGRPGLNRGIDLSQLPATHIDKSKRMIGIFMSLFSIFWGGVPLVILLNILNSGNGENDPAIFILFLFPLIGLGLLFAGIWMATHQKTIRIDANSVAVDSRSLFSHKNWVEPMHRYTGVLSRSERRSGGKNRSSYTLYIVELFHPDKNKRITLYVSRSEEGLRKKWENYARQLNKPALEGEAGNFRKREVEDLDKSVGELVKEGKLEVNFDPGKAPPKGFKTAVEHGKLRIELPMFSRFPFAILIALLFPAVFIYIGFWASDGPLIFGIFGILFLVFMAYAFLWRIIATPVLLLERSRIRLFHKTPWGETAGKILQSGNIESVRIGRITDRNVKEGVLVATDDHTMKIGEGLPVESLDWLKNCILTVIASDNNP